MLPQLEQIDLVLADPPYGINTKSDGMGKLSPWADLCNSAYWYAAWISECRAKLKHDGSLWSFLNWRSMVTFQKAACDISWPMESVLIWDKQWIGPGGQKGLRPSYEMVALWAMPNFSIENRGIADIRRCQWSSVKPSGHPAEKPLDLVSWLISITGAASVLDPFMGSGTTLVAAKALGLKAIGIEISEAYCRTAIERLRQGSLFNAMNQVEEREGFSQLSMLDGMAAMANR